MAVYDLLRIDMPEPPAGFRDDTHDLHYVPAPCQVACPVGTDAASYIGLIWEGRLAEAFEAITATNPFSSICGRVCDAPCEPACRRADSDGPLQIRNLKRFVMDQVGHRFDPPAVPVTKEQTIGVVGAGPAGLTAAHDLCAAGYEVHVYEMSDRPGGMMVWGIPAFRLPRGVIDADLERLRGRCPGLHVHLNTALGDQVSLAELKQRHAAVLLAIGAWWGKPMGIPGEEHGRVVDGVGWLRRINAGERPVLPKKVVVVGGGDVAMDVCRAARRLPGGAAVTVLYRRGPAEIPARRIELEGAVAEGVAFVYHTQPVAVQARDAGLALRCVRTEPGEPDRDGRRRPLRVPGSEHDVDGDLVIVCVGQRCACDELDRIGLLRGDRVDTDFDTMRTTDPQVFAAGDGAFGGSTIVNAMHHGQRAAYYVRAYLEGVDEPIPYRTPYRTRRVPVADDPLWERLGPQHPEFLGLGRDPATFPEIEVTYDARTARKEAARCYRCDAETGTPDYSVRHREDLFSMARIGPGQLEAQRAMLRRRLQPRDNPFPATRPAQLEDIVFLPANLSRLVIDPYREACRVSYDLGGRLELAHPFLVTGFDAAPTPVRQAVALGLAAAQGLYLGEHPLSRQAEGPEGTHARREAPTATQAPGAPPTARQDPARSDAGAGVVPWLQLLVAEGQAPSAQAAALLQVTDGRPAPRVPERRHERQLTGLVLSSAGHGSSLDALEATIVAALDQGADLLLLNAIGACWPRDPWAELRGAPDLRLLRDAVRVLRRLRREGEIDLVYFGGVRSGTDAAKLIGLGAVAMVLGVSAGLAAGGRIRSRTGQATDGRTDGRTGPATLTFVADPGGDERRQAVANLIRANTSEASMMARCGGKTVLHNIEPEDLRALTLATSEATGLPLAGVSRAESTD